MAALDRWLSVDGEKDEVSRAITTCFTDLISEGLADAVDGFELVRLGSGRILRLVQIICKLNAVLVENNVQEVSAEQAEVCRWSS